MNIKAEIMKEAWNICKQAAEQFGGKAHEYLSGALKQAWGDRVYIKTVATLDYLSTIGKRWSDHMVWFVLGRTKYGAIRNDDQLKFVTSEKKNGIFVNVPVTKAQQKKIDLFLATI